MTPRSNGGNNLILVNSGSKKEYYLPSGLFENTGKLMSGLIAAEKPPIRQNFIHQFSKSRPAALATSRNVNSNCSNKRKNHSYNNVLQDVNSPQLPSHLRHKSMESSKRERKIVGPTRNSVALNDSLSGKTGSKAHIGLLNQTTNLTL